MAVRPRVGHIKFINCIPLYYGLVKQHVLWDVDLIKETPARLNRYLRAGRLDISPISSIEYAHNWRDLLLLPNLSISSDGPVTSVYLVSKLPAEKLGGRNIVLTNTSATSQILLKIILADKYKVKPVYFTSPPNLDSMLSRADAALFIGDPALNLYYKKPPGLYIYDLGAEWKELARLKMVFAVWAVRRDFAKNKPELAGKVNSDFNKAMACGLANIEEVAREASRWELYSKEFLQEYFSTLKYGFGEEYQQGLKEYYRRANALGHIAEIPEFNFLEA